MNMRSMKVLVVTAVVLILGVIVLDTSNDDYATSGGKPLLPELATRINDITQVRLQYPDSAVTVAKRDDRWVVEEKDGYAANTGTLRQVLIALKDAARLEQKTANPEMHGQLGLAEPGDGTAIGLTISGQGFEDALVIGKVAQQSYRYVRFADQDQTWLIDQNPEIPADAAGWLAPNILDVRASDVQSVSLEHADGDTVSFTKQSPDDSAYSVADIPQGRELSYPGVVNGIAGALQGLDLEDVMQRPDSLPDATVIDRFTTYDGLRITVRRHVIDEQPWFGFAADTVPVPADAADDTAGPADVPETDATAEVDDEVAGPANPAGSADDGEPTVAPAQRAEELNAELGDWLYRLPDYKAKLLARGWDDLLKAPPTADDDGA